MAGRCLKERRDNDVVCWLCVYLKVINLLSWRDVFLWLYVCVYVGSNVCVGHQ